MKLSRIEPFVAVPEADAEAALVAKRIQAKSQDAAPVAATASEQGLDSSTDSGVADGIVRLSEFLHKFSKKNKNSIQEQKRRKNVIRAYTELTAKVDAQDNLGVRLKIQI